MTKKLKHLVRSDTISAAPSLRYSRMIRRLRLFLPVLALGIAAVVFVWSDVQRNRIVPVPDKVALPEAAAKNELINPRFESTDKEGRPFTVTAAKALQKADDENLVLLEAPLAGMKLESGETVALKADGGSFRQDLRMLFLRGHVQIDHARGYQLTTAEMDVDLRANTALSKTSVQARGPEGTLEAKGLQGDSGKGVLVFNGPAKLVLTDVSSGMGGLFGE